MSDVVERELRAAFASKVVSVSPAIGERLRTADYAPRRRHRPVIAGFGALGASLAAAVVFALTLLSSGPSMAFAGWTAVPTASSPAATKAARMACGRVARADLLATDQRGPYTAIVYEHGAKPTECITDGRRVLLSQSTLYPPRMFASPGAGNVTLPIPSPHWWTHPQRRLTAVSGTVGPGVTGVRLRLANGTSVAATVGHGWYMAWWPGSFTNHAYPTTIIVTTHTGTRRAPYSASRLHDLFAGCRLGTRCLAFERAIKGWLDLLPSLPDQLVKHYSLFRTIPPGTDLKSLRQGDLLPPQNITGMGLDLKQVRALKFGQRVTLYVVPGSAGVCLAAREKGGGELMSCQRSPLAWQQGTISLGGGGGGPGGMTFYAIALVADPNHTVAVKLDDGRTVVLPVKDNIAFGSFPIQPTQITFKNAAGKLTRYG